MKFLFYYKVLFSLSLKWMIRFTEKQSFKKFKQGPNLHFRAAEKLQSLRIRGAGTTDKKLNLILLSEKWLQNLLRLCWSEFLIIDPISLHRRITFLHKESDQWSRVCFAIKRKGNEWSGKRIWRDSSNSHGHFPFFRVRRSMGDGGGRGVGRLSAEGDQSP